MSDADKRFGIWHSGLTDRYYAGFARRRAGTTAEQDLWEASGKKHDVTDDMAAILSRARAEVESEMGGRVEAEMNAQSIGQLFHMVHRQMQAAYSAGLRDGPEAAMQWLGGALVGPGALPPEGSDPDWYADDAWTEGPPWHAIPEANATAGEPYEPAASLDSGDAP